MSLRHDDDDDDDRSTATIDFFALATSPGKDIVDNSAAAAAAAAAARRRFHDEDDEDDDDDDDDDDDEAIDTRLSLGSQRSSDIGTPSSISSTADDHPKARPVGGDLLVLGPNPGNPGGDDPAAPRDEFLFSKALTSSDVNKLNRLVINKRHARESFPRLSEAARDPAEDPAAPPSEVVLVFHDQDSGKWPFNYKYWTSSKTYVFSKGWIQYVKRYDLACGDEVLFYREEPSGRLKIRHKKVGPDSNRVA